MRLIILLLALLPAVAHADLRVFATVPDLAAIARDLGGKHVTVTSLSLHTQDPHFVDAKPSLVLDLNRADLLLAVGLELETGWLPILQTGARNAAIQVGGRGYLDCSEFVDILDVPTRQVDRSEGDIHPGGNPHYLRDPRAAGPIAAGIAERMAELDPQNAAEYRRQLTAFRARLDRARAGWEERLAVARGTPILGYHKSWTYLVAWLGLVEVGFLEPLPGIPPSPSHVARMLTLSRARGVKLVLMEDFYPGDTAKLVAAKIPARLVRLPGATAFRQGETYIEHIEAVVVALEKALRP
jgi:zinc/manganese transport system substrate-binding protein